MPITLIALLAAKARSAAGWLLGLARDNPWQVAVVGALALAWWQWSGKQELAQSRDEALASLTAERNGRKADQATWRQQVADARAAIVAAEQKSKEIAIDAQQSHQALLADNAGLRDYIAGHRLRSGTPGAATAASAGGDIGAGVPADAASGTFVATSEADLVICDADYAYAAGAHQFIQELIGSGLAK